MIGGAGWWTRAASTTLLQPKKWNAHFCITFNFWWLARLVIGLEPHPPPVSSQKKWNAHFWITFNFWWSAGLVDELESHLPPLSSQKNEVLIFGLCSTSDDWPGWSMDSNPICHLSPAKEWNANFGLCSTSDDQLGWSMDSNPICYPSPNKKMICSFLDYVQLLMIGQAGQWTQTPSATSLQPKIWNVCFWITFNFWWSARLVEGLEPHLQPLSNQKNEMLIFVLCSTSGNQPGWSMDSNPICHPSPTKKMKCLFLDYVQLLMIGQAGQRTPTPSVTPLQPKKWNACFCIMVNFWWSAGLVDELESHLPPLSSQKNEVLIFGLCSTSDDWLGWSMDSNPICHPSPNKKMICSFLYYIQVLIIGWAGQWTWTPSATSLQPKKWNAHFWITFNFWWLAGLVNGLKPHLPPLSRHKMKCSFLHYIQLVMIGRAGQWTQTKSATPLQPKKWNANFWITFNFWWSAGLVDGLEPHLPPLSSQKMKCSFLDYVQLLMIGQVGQWTQTPSATSLQPKKLNACFWIMFNFWWLARLVNGLEPHLQPLSNQKNDMLVFRLCWTSDDWPGWSMDLNPICYPSPAKKMKCLFLDYVQLLMISRAGQWIQTPSTTHLQP